MGKPKPKAKPSRATTAAVEAGVARAAAAAAPVGMQADDDTEEALAIWKRTHQAKLLAEHENELARSRVAALFAKHRVQYFLSTLGTVALQMRGGTARIDFEAIARAVIAPSKLEKLIPTYTKTSDVTPTVAAPSGWSAELGLKSHG